MDRFDSHCHIFNMTSVGLEAILKLMDTDKRKSWTDKKNN